jgi:alpha-N-arabinofuranosidase
LIAEGGTAEHHAITIARSESVTGPYEPCPHNPLLTHRHLGPDAAITGTGHADLIQTQTGEWWAVMLAMRPYRYRHYNLGRETFLAPVTWYEGWPYISVDTGRLEVEYPVPDLPEAPVDVTPARDDFDAAELAHPWMMLRTPRETFYSLTERPGHLRLRLRPEQISAWTNPSFIGRRQQHGTFVARAVMDFAPASEAECAGLVLLQNNDFQFRFVVTLADGERVIQLIQREKGSDTVLAQSPAPASRIYFHVSGAGSAYSFFVAETANQWQTVAESVDGALLSTQAAGGFVGTVVGLYASSNGQASENVADWDWFEYSGKDAE